MQKVLNVNPALRVPLPSPRLETRPPSHGQVYRFAASDDGTSCDVRVHDVLVGRAPEAEASASSSLTGGTAPSTICSAIPSWKPEHWHIDNLHHNVDHVPRFGIADHVLQTLRDWHIDVLFDAPSHLHCRVNRGSRAISAAMNGSCHGQAHRQLLTAPVASQTSHASTLCCRSNVTTSHGPGVRRFKRATWSSCTRPSCLQRASKKRLHAGSWLKDVHTV